MPARFMSADFFKSLDSLDRSSSTWISTLCSHSLFSFYLLDIFLWLFMLLSFHLMLSNILIRSLYASSSSLDKLCRGKISWYFVEIFFYWFVWLALFARSLDFFFLQKSYIGCDISVLLVVCQYPQARILQDVAAVFGIIFVVVVLIVVFSVCVCAHHGWPI